MKKAPVLKGIETVVDELIDPSDPMKGNVAFSVFDASMSLPVKVERLHPSHDGKRYYQHTAKTMVNHICGQKKGVRVQQHTCRAKGTNALVVHSLLAVFAHHLLQSVIAVRRAVCKENFSQQNRFLCLGGHSRKLWMDHKYSSLTTTMLYEDVLNTDIVYETGD